MTDITAIILRRVLSGRLSFSDPCIICGEIFNSGRCPHNVLDTEPIIKRVKKMSKAEKEKILKNA